MTQNFGSVDDISTPASTRLAAEIRRLRRAANLSQPALAGVIGYSRQYVSLAERPGKGLASAELVRALDHALGARGVLIKIREQAVVERQRLRVDLTATATPAVSSSALGSVVDGSGVATIQPVCVGEDLTIVTRAGRFFAGAAIDAKAYSVMNEHGRLLATVPADLTDEQLLRRPRRALVVGVVTNDDHVQLVGMDNRQARRQLSGAAGERRLLMPHAYALDDLTVGILWAVANLDEPLLDDDSALSSCGLHLRAYETLPRSAAGRDTVADLAIVSQMWLGSDFCARHILRYADLLASVPTFWTRERHGEEASTWLLFGHKYDYLRRTRDRFTGPAEPVRIFCIPESALAGSTRPERILLLLAAALMESFDIRVEVCVAPEYIRMEGFVLDERRHAIVANWVGADGIWQVDVTDSRPTLRRYADVTGYARAHSITRAASSVDRLQALADYLDVNWAWLSRRCTELGEYGAAGIAAPRSRLLSTVGVDRACRYIGNTSRLAD